MITELIALGKSADLCIHLFVFNEAMSAKNDHRIVSLVLSYHCIMIALPPLTHTQGDTDGGHRWRRFVRTSSHKLIRV